MLLRQVVNSRGGTQNIAYLRSTDSAVASNDRGHDTRWLVRSVEDRSGRETGTAAGRKVLYYYNDSVFDTARKRSLGFRKVQAFLPKIRGESQSPVVVSFYDNTSFARNGALIQRAYYKGDIYQEKIVYEQDVRDLGNGPFYSRIAEIRQFSRDGSETTNGSEAAEGTTRKRRFTHDPFGRIDRIQEFGYVDASGQSLVPSERSTTFISFAQKIDGATYIVNRPTRFAVVAGLQTSLSDVAPENRLVSQTFAYDNLAGYQVGTVGDLTSVTIANTGAPEPVSTITYRYDAYGNITASFGPRDGQRAGATYGGPYGLFLFSSTNALGHESVTRWHYGCQTPIAVRDANGLPTNFEYDVHCREKTRTLSTGHTISTAYGALGNPNEQFVQVLQPSASAYQVAGQDIHLTRTYFDGLGRTWRTTTPGSFNTLATSTVSLTGYDARGNVAWTSIPMAWSSTNNKNWGDPAAYPPASIITQYDYDNRDRPTKTTHPNGAVETTSYTRRSATPAGGSSRITYREVTTKSAECSDTRTSPRRHARRSGRSSAAATGRCAPRPSILPVLPRIQATPPT